MNNLTGYDIIEQLYSSDKIVVLRAVRKADNLPVVLKMLKAEYPEPQDIARLNYEYDLLKQLNIPEIIRVYNLEVQQNHFALVLESVSNSATLRTYLNSHQLNIVAFLRLAIQIADALDKIHEAGIIHKDINPDNILVIGEGEAIKILDLSLATQLSEEEHEITNSELLEGTLPYISPEQTTRMNRPIDRRTDLYSLGITFYEMLVGHRPFDAKDAIEWVHSHIAKQPMAPHKLISSIPEMVSLIVLKLLAKSAEDRYATAYGLKADLEEVLIAWQKNHRIPNFELGKKDRRGIFQIPQKLYGREAEIKTLLNAFDNVSKGQRELLLIAGYTGVGKSSLINEIQKPIVKLHGYFTSGKYENYNREVPYAGLIQAFKNLINQILAGNKQRIEGWQQDILKVISPNAQVIINVIPELEKLVGKQPPVVELPPAESRTRFEMVFFDFVSVFAKKEHPLVIFMDDLQWADSGSFNLISQLMKNTELKYFLLLGAYRDNEITATHPLALMLENFNKEHLPYKEIQLKPLSINNLKQLVSDTLQTTQEIQSLTDLIMEKTAGNPYFVNLFLNMLYKTRQLSFDPAHDWVFDIDAIKNSPITDNVVDLVISEIGKLSPETQELLRFAACIGTDFNLESLRQLTDKPADEITSLLWPALKEKWILQLGESYKQMTKNVYGNQLNIQYRFSHDNVKHTLYSLTDSATRLEVHYKLGHNLLKEYQQGHEENLFTITQHFSACLEKIQDPEEKIALAKLFYHAANQMKLSISYDMAIKHYENALQLLGPDCWQQQYNLTMDIYNNLAISNYLSGSFEKSNTLFEEVITRAKTPLDKAQIYNFRALAYNAHAQYADAIAACEEGLRILGVKIPKQPGKFLLIRTWIKIKWALRNKSINDLLDLPIMQDPHKITIMELLEKLATTSYMNSPNNFNKPTYAIMLAVWNSMKYGNHSNSAITYTLFGQIEIVRGNVERAYQFSQLAIKLCERFQNINLPIVYLIAITRIFSWKLPYKEIINYAVKAFDLSYETGQMYGRQFSGITMVAMMNFANLPISEVDKKIKDLFADHQLTYNQDITRFLTNFREYIRILRNEGGEADYQSYVADINAQSKIRAPILGIVGTKLQEINLAYMFEDWTQVMKVVQETEKTFMKKPLNTMMAAPGYYFNYALTMLSLYHEASFFKRLAYRRKLNKILTQMNIWQSNCPSNFAPLYYLVKAGIISEVKNNINLALKDYEAALELSRQTDRILIQAIAHEFIARCFLRRQQYRSARSYIQDAYAAFQQAGYGSKMGILRRNFPEIISKTDVVSKSTSTSYHSTSVLDVDTVLKSAQTISGQMKLEKLLETLIAIVMENAGAQRSVLLLVENGRLIVEAEGKIEEKSIILQKEPIESREDLALSIIQYVENTQEPVVLGNVSAEGGYTEDPYVIQTNPSSILCTPILYKNYLFGILYLENNLVCDAFTQKHLELLKVLSSQIAISLENARLYSAYDQFIPHEFLDILGKHSIMDITLGDNVQKEMSVLFTDIRGFSKLSEQLGPQEIFRFMNNYLGHMAPIIKNHGGFIDKFIGDAIMALFAGDVASAITAGIAIQHELVNFNQELIIQGKQPIEIGIGINSGHLTLGTLGGLNRIETSVLSDAVNLAERIQELTKKYDCRLLISGTAYQKLAKPEHFDLRFIDRTTVRGRDEVIDVWEVYNGDPDELRYAKLAVAKHYNEAIDYFLNQSYQKALLLFQRCLASLPNDRPLLKHIAQCQQLLTADEPNEKSSDQIV